MTPPERIYLQWEDDDIQYGCTWCQDQVNDTDAEYIRLDLFNMVTGALGDARKTITELYAKLETDRLNFEALMADSVGR